MDIYDKILVSVFILANGLVIGGVWHQMKEKRKDITPGMFQGAMLAALAGVGLLINKILDEASSDLDVKYYIFMALWIGVAVLAFMYRKASKDIKMIWLIVGLAAAAGTLMALFNIIDGLEEAIATATDLGTKLATLMAG